ncbi:MAG TPA: lipid II flippase MurJ [Candidatus Paceibacterota bacterium]|nr:lipid II flippase MurJ [Candidatus Paceibacterota bacterium]
MVRKIFGRLTAPVRGLHQAAYLLAALTLASQLLALLRDRIFAHTFGASETLDLYYAAFKIPDLVFALVASLVSAYVLIPRIASSGKKDARVLISETASFLLIGGGVLCLVLAVFARDIAFTFFPDFASSSEADQFVLLIRLLLVQPLLLGLSGILTSVTQIERKFFLFALSPVLYNLGIIAGTVFLYPIYGLIGIGWGVIAGAVLHVSIHLPVVWKAGLTPRLCLPRFSLLKDVVADSAPRSLALAMSAVTMLLLTVLAAGVGEGSVAVFTFAANLEAVPLALIGASYATAAFPVLAEQVGQKKFEEFRATLTAAARHLIFWSSAALVLFIVLRAHLVRIILGSGAFDWDATRLTAAVLAILVMALVAQGFVLLASRAFYASGRSWNPFLIQLGGALISGACAWGFLALARAEPLVRYFVEGLFRVEDVPGSEILLIALGALVGQLVMGVIAFATLKDVAPGVGKDLIRPLFEGMGAAILGGSAAYGALSFMGNIAPLSNLFLVFTQGAVAGMVGLVVSAAVLVLLENREFRDLYQTLRRLTSTRALPPSGSILGGPNQ